MEIGAKLPLTAKTNRWQFPAGGLPGGSGRWLRLF
jgi:hypothetical protein